MIIHHQTNKQTIIQLVIGKEEEEENPGNNGQNCIKKKITREKQIASQIQ